MVLRLRITEPFTSETEKPMRREAAYGLAAVAAALSAGRDQPALGWIL